jgi:RNA polymerase sigma factor (sigma-70 family)
MTSSTRTAGRQAPADAPEHWVLDAVARHERPLILYASRLLGDAERARDVVQDAFLKLCAQDRDHVADRLAEWLFTVCRNRALDVLRKEGRMSRLGEDQVSTCPSPEPDPADSAESRESAALVLECLERLPANQREVIRLKFQGGFSYREISRISGHSISNVGFLIHTGLKTLRKRLADGLPAEA